MIFKRNTALPSTRKARKTYQFKLVIEWWLPLWLCPVFWWQTLVEMLSALTKQVELKDIYCIPLFKNYLEQWGWWFQRAKLVGRPERNHFRQKAFNRCSFVRIRGLSLFLDQLWCPGPWGHLHKTSDFPMTGGGYCASNDCETQEIKGHIEHEHTCCENVPLVWTHEREIYWLRDAKEKVNNW